MTQVVSHDRVVGEFIYHPQQVIAGCFGPLQFVQAV